MWRKVVAAAFVALLIAEVLGTHSRTSGQEKKAKGRLPPYYSAIVTDQQREAIYLIQAKYAQQLAALQEQMDAMEKQRNTDIENVLSPQQKLLLLKAQEAAATKKKKAADDKIAVKVAELEAAKAPPPDAKKIRGKKDKEEKAKEPEE
jgi:hypothetical protein